MITRLLRDGWRMLWPLLLAASVGWLFNVVWPVLATALALLFWQMWQKWRLARWLARGELLEPPFAGGLWEDYYTRLMHLFRAEQRAQNDLQSVIERARHHADSLDTGVLLLSGKGELQYSNRAARQLLGLSIADQGQVLLNLKRHPDFRQWLDARQFDRPFLMLPHFDSITLQYRASSLANQEILLLVEDVSHQQALETLRRDFVANVSHELKTPLTVFKGYLEMVLDSLPTDQPQWVRALQHMQIQSNRMEALVRDLLLLSRLESTDAKNRQVIVLAELQNKLMLTFDYQASLKQQQLIWNIPDSLSINADPEELQSALSNLIGNAIKYTPDGGIIRIDGWQDEKGAHIAIEDNGDGIEPWHLPHLTERFYRVDKSRSVETGGTGLGLAIVKHVLQRHNGHLTIASTPGQGSLFTCHFPHGNSP